MSTLELQVYDIFRVKLGEAEASKVIEFIDFKTTAKVEVKSEIFEQIINKDVSNLRNEMKLDIANIKTEGSTGFSVETHLGLRERIGLLF
jgi:hypothetical protein